MTGDPWANAMRKIANGEDVQHACEEVHRGQIERTREMLLAEGRPDLVEELDRNLRDERLGLTRARSVWHSISPAQRRVLHILAEGRVLFPIRHTTGFCAHARGLDAPGEVCKRPTVRALHARSLIEPCADNVFAYALTEHGRFVLKHGPALSSTGEA